MRPPLNAILLTVLILGSALRLVGLARGHSDFVREPQTAPDHIAEFYRFHPDEEMVIRAALQPLDPQNPPLTVYGLLPLHLLRAALEIATPVLNWGPLDLDAPNMAFPIYVVARLLAALAAILVLWFTWLLGRRYFDTPTALLATAFVAFAPGAIQQAHFFIADGFFTLLSTATLYALLRALELDDKRHYLLTGLLIGLTAAVRLNGALLGLVAWVGLYWQSRTANEPWWKCLRQSQLWLAAGGAVLALLLVQPYLVLNPGRLWETDTPDDFGAALAAMGGDVLHTWILADLHTTPYLHHWTHLLPLIAGWPLTIAFALGLVYGLRRADLPKDLILMWCALYFALIGGMQAKAVRYLIPLLPFFSLFAAALCTKICRGELPLARRRAGRALTAAVVLFSTFYGLAFAHIYTVEDSRIQAGRWIAQNIAPGSAIAIEKGGFSMRPVVSPQTYRQRYLEIMTFFNARGYFSCAATLSYLQARLYDDDYADYIVLVDSNRYRQFTAAADLFPALAAFYRELAQENLGFSIVQRFKQYPQFMGLQFADDDAETSFLGYDHPAVMLFKKDQTTAVTQALRQLRQALLDDPHCADRPMRQAANHLRDGDLQSALAQLNDVALRHPLMRVSHFIAAHIHQLNGDTQEQTAALERYRAGLADRSIHLVPLASGMTLLHLELNDLALQALADGLHYLPHCTTRQLHFVKSSYEFIATLLDKSGQQTRANYVQQLAAAVEQHL